MSTVQEDCITRRLPFLDVDYFRFVLQSGLMILAKHASGDVAVPFCFFVSNLLVFNFFFQNALFWFLLFDLFILSSRFRFSGRFLGLVKKP
jgi:hypothetical protein